MPGGALSSSGSLGSRFPAFPGITTPLRLPTSRLGSLRFSLASRYSGLTLSSLSTAAVGFGSPSRGFSLPWAALSQLAGEKVGSPKFPDRPFGCMPRSTTPVGSPKHRCWLRRMLPSGPAKPSASLQHHPISGLHHAAYILAPPGFVLGLLLRTQDSLPACQRALAGWDFPPIFW